MKLNLLIFQSVLFIYFLISPCYSKGKLPDVKGGFSSCSVYEYTAQPNSGEFDINTKRLEKTYKYDKNGNIIESMHFLKEGFLDRTVILYDWKNRKISDISINNFDSNKISTFYKYDGIDNLIEIITFKNDSVVKFRDVFQYNKENKIISADYYQVANNPVSQKLENGCILYFPGDTSRTVFNYDTKGRMYEQLIYNVDNTIRSKFLKIFRSDGKVIESIDTNYSFYKYPLGNYTKGTFTVSLTSKYYDENGYLIESVTKTFDDNKNPLKSICPHSFKYKYDEFGNIIEQIEINDNKPDKMIMYVYTK